MPKKLTEMTSRDGNPKHYHQVRRDSQGNVVDVSEWASAGPPHQHDFSNMKITGDHNHDYIERFRLMEVED